MRSLMSPRPLILLSCAALLGLWSPPANADPNTLYKPIREMWSVPFKAWSSVTAAHVKQFTHPKTGTPSANLFNPMAHTKAWLATSKNSLSATKKSWAAWHRGVGTLQLWRGSYHQGRALATGMVGNLPLSSTHTITARQYEASSKLHMKAAKLLAPAP